MSARLPRIVCFGEMLLRYSPGDEGDLRTAASFDVHVAGAEANVAISLASLGASAGMVTVVPDTPLGARARETLVRHGVDISGMTFGAGRMGLFYIGSQQRGREGGVLYDRDHSAFAHAEGNSFDWCALLDGADWLHVSGITAALGERALANLREAVAAARVLGVRISFDCNFRPALWTGREARGAELLAEFAGQADLLFASPHDLALMLGNGADRLEGGNQEDGHDASRFEAGARKAFAIFPGLSVMASTSRSNLGNGRQALAAHLARPERCCHVPAVEIVPLVERIGAGDAFAAALLYGLSNQWDDARIAAFAHRATLLKHSIPGDFSALPQSQIWP